MAKSTESESEKLPFRFALCAMPYAHCNCAGQHPFVANAYLID